jgi:hypothetical protein
MLYNARKNVSKSYYIPTQQTFGAANQARTKADNKRLMAAQIRLLKIYQKKKK